MVTLAFRQPVVLRSIFITCVVIEIVLVLLDYHVNYAHGTDLAPMRRFFNMTREDALGSWVAVTQTLFVALTLWLIVLIVRAQARPRWVKIGWVTLASFFSYMALDDGTELHERLGSSFRMMQSGDNMAEPGILGGFLELFPSYAWQVLFVPLFGAIGLFILWFLWRELGTRRARMGVIAALACLTVAVGLDFVEGLDEGHDWNLYTWVGEMPGVEDFTIDRFDRDAFTALRHFGKSLEEAIEMFGMTLFWVVFLSFAMSRAGELQVQFRD